MKELETENSKTEAADPTTRTSIEVVENFLKNHPVMCYGGIAINNLLPPKDQFYDFEVEVPDYDFFSKTPQNHAMMLADQLYAKGIKAVEVKPGMHLGTFKVFANYVSIADITEIDSAIFDALWEQRSTIKGINYVPPNFLRMSMYLELSRPRGDVSRWEKVYERLQLLNRAHPATCPKGAEPLEKASPKFKTEVTNLLKKEPLILLGAAAADIHLYEEWSLPIMLLGEAEVVDRLTSDVKASISPESETSPERVDVMSEDGTNVIQFYKTTACHSYHSLSNGIRIASIPTILQFVFSHTYSGTEGENVAGLLCIAQRLVDIAHTKPKRRFAILTPKECLGTQMTLVDMRKEKSDLYSKLADNKTSAEYLRYFFTYNPAENGTRKKKLRSQLKKTRKDVISS